MHEENLLCIQLTKVTITYNNQERIRGKKITTIILKKKNLWQSVRISLHLSASISDSFIYKISSRGSQLSGCSGTNSPLRSVFDYCIINNIYHNRVSVLAPYLGLFAHEKVCSRSSSPSWALSEKMSVGALVVPLTVLCLGRLLVEPLW